MSEDERIIDATGRVLYTGHEPHPFRTNTRFIKVDGRWEAMPEAKQPQSARKAPRTADEREADRVAAATRRKAEEQAMAKVRRAIEKRQAIGDPDVRVSEGEDFPLMETLRRDGAKELIDVVLRYRRLVALCEAEPLKGMDYSKRDGGEIVRESKKLTPEADIDTAAASGWKSIPDGEIKQSTKIKRSKGAHSLPPKRVVVSNVDEAYNVKTESLHIKITDEILNEQIDAKPILAELRGSLGPLVEPMEDAVLGGMTMRSIGESAGFSGRSAFDAGKALVGTALSAMNIKWAEISKRAKLAQAIALRRFKTRQAANDNTPTSKVA